MIRRLILAITAVLTIMTLSPALVNAKNVTDSGQTSGTSSTASTSNNCVRHFYIVPSWDEYLNPTKSSNDASGCTNNFKFPTDIPAVGMALIDILLRIAGLVAIVSIVVAGISYMTSGGSPDKAASARRRIYNSLIGLAIVSVAVAFVTFIGNRLGG